MLSQFCDEFEGVVRPLLIPLEKVAATLGVASETVSAREILPGLHDLRHQLHALADKVAGQQAYVLIFGPLKSGKSTLMNAMSAAYVSEVTSLPAYPCLVNVAHSEEREFQVTRYDGQVQAFTDFVAMRMQLERAHTELADRIREVEALGEEFDPGVHFAQAIRSISVKVPAGDLAESGAVLVDTPGLYTRMKFGYDRMTREFRDTAACAIFVVKTDNLFLEQVFEEFNELLELFSRIFLVVNLDTSKQDLRPDGSLVPSLEREDPIRIIQAFENLSMSAPLKQALDQGRLRIYPTDLLRAASKRLAEHGQVGSTGATLAGSGHAEEIGRESDFDDFLGDLTEYLNSTDYLVAFLGDSLRHAESLLSEIGELCSSDSVRQLSDEVERMEQERASLKVKTDTLQRLGAFNWEEAYRPLHDQILFNVEAEVEPIREKSALALSGALESWFKTDASLHDLVDRDWGNVLASCQNELAMTVHQTLERTMALQAGGVLVPQGQRAQLIAAGIDLPALGRQALQQIDPYAGITKEQVPVASAELPVKKGFWDWVLFRGQASVRRKLFGPANNPKLRISKVVKSKRLGEPARDHLRQHIEDHFEGFFPRAIYDLVGSIYGDYSETAIQALSAQLETKRRENEEKLRQMEGRLAEISRVRNDLAELQSSLDRSEEHVDALGRRYGETDPALLKQPVEQIEPLDTLEAGETGPVGGNGLGSPTEIAVNES